MQDNNEKKTLKLKNFEGISPMINIIKCVAIAYAITIIIFIAYAIILTYTEFTEKQIPIVVIITIIISVMVAGYDSAKSANSKGWLWGMTAGLIYAVILIIIGVLSTKGNIEIEFSTIVMLIMSIAGGGLGGMIGINAKKSK